MRKVPSFRSSFSSRGPVLVWLSRSGSVLSSWPSVAVRVPRRSVWATARIFISPHWFSPRSISASRQMSDPRPGVPHCFSTRRSLLQFSPRAQAVNCRLIFCPVSFVPRSLDLTQQLALRSALSSSCSASWAPGQVVFPRFWCQDCSPAELHPRCRPGSVPVSAGRQPPRVPIRPGF